MNPNWACIPLRSPNSLLMHQAAPNVQIIAATQSPTLANHFGWADFIVVDRHEDASRFRRLTEDEVKPWMDDFAMGEIWEKNPIIYVTK
jgi:predicted ATP-dependent endonuclease of OLD family